MENIQYHELLRTKLFLPLPPLTHLSRARLIHKMNASLSYKFTLITAPAGYGKTTLLSEWATQTVQSVAWLTIDEADNDPVRFWCYIIAALQTVHPAIGNRTLLQLQIPVPPPLEMALTALINDLASLSQPFTLILDDYHHIYESTIHHLLRFFLDQQPPVLHLILTTRIDPPLALARRRAHGELIELRGTTLCFTSEEATHLLTQKLSLPVSEPQIAMLQTITEGWPAALHLAALSLSATNDLPQALLNFTGSHRHVMDYLVDDVLTQQSASVRTFLLSTAHLDRFTGDLCDTLTGRTDGQEMLEQLDHSNLFLLPLDDQRHWYRYHHLFADALRVQALYELGKEKQILLYQRASAWYEQHGLLTEAVETALVASDYATVVRIGLTLGPALMLAGHYATLVRWIQQLPHELLLTTPETCMALAWTYVLLGQQKAVQEPLQEAERVFVTHEDRSGLGRVAVIRALLACLQRASDSAVRFAQEALTLLPDEIGILRSFCNMTLGWGYRLQGEVALAKQALLEARLLAEQVNNPPTLLGSMLFLGEVLMLQGQLTQAIPYYQGIIQGQQNWTPFSIEARIDLCSLLLERNDLAGAMAQIELALALSYQREEAALIARCLLLQARILRVYAPGAQVEEAFLRAIVLARQSKNPHLLALARAYQVRWWLVQGHLEATRQWLTDCAFNREEIPVYEQEDIALTVVRVLIAQGEADTAEHILDRWQAFARKQGRVGSQIEMLILSSLALDAQGLVSRAIVSLQQALLLAEAGQYCRFFVEEGSPIARLLHLIALPAQRKRESAYLENLIKALPLHQAERSSLQRLDQPAPILDPLSPREYKVLRLLAAGLSTREIANELIVSLNTVKTQLKSAYRKLNATSREEALANARYWKVL